MKPPRFDSTIKGAFKGWRRGALFEFTNGQVWEQTDGTYDYQYLYRPEAVVDGDQLWVEDMDEPVTVRRVR